MNTQSHFLHFFFSLFFTFSFLFFSFSEDVSANSTISENAFGANIHLRQRIPMDQWDAVLTSAEKAGIRWAREEFEWDVIEPTDNTYSFDTYDAVVDVYAEYDIEVLGLLTYSSSWASTNPGSPYADFYAPQEEAWREYVRTVSQRYADDIDTWEIWNEPNHPSFFRSEFSDYVSLLEIAEEEITKSNPNARIVLGGLSGTDVDYLDRLLSRLSNPSIIDVVAIHPYREVDGNFNYAPEKTVPQLHTLQTDLYAIRSVLLSYNLENTPIWLTEVGWTTYAEGVDQKTQAQYLTRLYTLALSVPQVKKVFWYSFTDTSDNTTFSEAHFGLLTSQYLKKESFAAFQFIKKNLQGSQFKKMRLPKQVLLSDFSEGHTWLATDQVCTRTEIESNTEKKRLKVEYRFTKKINCYSPITRVSRLPKKTKALIFSARGSNDPTQLRVRIVDATGETFQYDLSRIPNEWSSYVVQLEDFAAYWGGNENGVLDYPLSFQSFVLDNGTGSMARGRVLFDDLYTTSVADGYWLTFRKGNNTRHAFWRNGASRKFPFELRSQSARVILLSQTKILQSANSIFRTTATGFVRFIRPL